MQCNRPSKLGDDRERVLGCGPGRRQQDEGCRRHRRGGGGEVGWLRSHRLHGFHAQCWVVTRPSKSHASMIPGPIPLRRMNRDHSIPRRGWASRNPVGYSVELRAEAPDCPADASNARRQRWRPFIITNNTSCWGAGFIADGRFNPITRAKLLAPRRARRRQRPANSDRNCFGAWGGRSCRWGVGVGAGGTRR